MTADDGFALRVEEVTGQLPARHGMARLVFVEGAADATSFAVTALAGATMPGFAPQADGIVDGGLRPPAGVVPALLRPYVAMARSTSRPVGLLVQWGEATTTMELIPDATGVTALWSEATTDRRPIAADAGSDGDEFGAASGHPGDSGPDALGWVALRAERDGEALRDLVCELSLGADEPGALLPAAGSRMSDWVAPASLDVLLDALSTRLARRRPFRPPPGMFGGSSLERRFDLWATPAGDGLMVRVRPRSRASAAADRAIADAVRLSRREQDILTLLAQGSSTVEIASTLYLSTNTVRNHVRRLLNRLGVSSRLEAVVVGTRMGLLEPSGDGRDGQRGDRPERGARPRSATGDR